MATIISLSRYVFLLYALLKKEYLSSEKKKIAGIPNANTLYVPDSDL